MHVMNANREAQEFCELRVLGDTRGTFVYGQEGIIVHELSQFTAIIELLRQKKTLNPLRRPGLQSGGSSEGLTSHLVTQS